VVHHVPDHEYRVTLLDGRVELRVCEHVAVPDYAPKGLLHIFLESIVTSDEYFDFV
jgi:hypothetical protein